MKKEEEDVAAKRATADKRRWGIKRQRLHVERWRRQLRGREVEASTRQPAGERETIAAAAAGTVMTTGNAVLPPSWDLAMTITTTPDNQRRGSLCSECWKRRQRLTQTWRV